MSDHTARQLQQQVQQAIAEQQPLNIFAGNSRAFYGHPVAGEACPVADHQGIIDYQPAELVITVKAGTRLSEIEQTLAGHNQMLAFDPPAFNEASTIGGCVAAGLSGPSRAFSGPVRDFVLGCRMINGRGEIVQFGGQVMKNVAGYDVSRLMAGSLGTLGILLDISLKVLPRPASRLSLKFDMQEEAAIKSIRQWAGQPLPISASCIMQEQLFIRLDSTSSAVYSARQKLGGDVIDNTIWQQLQDQQMDFFQQDKNLWRLSLPPATAPLNLPGEQIIEWHGGQRWIHHDGETDIFALASSLGGHACLYKTRSRADDIFQPLDTQLMRLQRNTKQAMDPMGIFNPGRIYRGL